MKKAALVLAVIMSCLCFTACDVLGGGNKKRDGEIYVTIAEAGIGVKWLETLALDYEEETGVVVNIYADPNLDSSIVQNMSIQKNLDDLYMTWNTYDWVKWSAQGKVAEITDIFEEEDDNGECLEERMLDEVRSHGIWDEKRYIAPFMYPPMGFVYNADILSSLGYDSFPDTWDSLITLCGDINKAKLTKNGKLVKPFSWGGVTRDLFPLYKSLWGMADPDEFYAFFLQNDTLGPKRELYVNDSMEKALDAIMKLLDAKNGVSANSVEGATGMNNIDAQTAFLNGYSLFCFTGSWFEGEMSSLITDRTFNFEFAPVPKLSGVTETYVLRNVPGEYFMIPSASANVDEAKEFLKFMFREDNLIKIHDHLQTPLAYDYDTTKVKLTDWGRSVINGSTGTSLIAASDAPFYRAGALSGWFRATDPFQTMLQGTVTNIRNDILVPNFERYQRDWANLISSAL